MDYRIFNVRTDVNACDCARGCTDTRKSLHWNLTGRKIPCRTPPPASLLPPFPSPSNPFPLTCPKNETTQSSVSVLMYSNLFNNALKHTVKKKKIKKSRILIETVLDNVRSVENPPTFRNWFWWVALFRWSWLSSAESDPNFFPVINNPELGSEV